MANTPVSFTLPGGTKVTSSKDLAEKIGGKPSEPKAPAKKAASSKTEK
jgi:hypothetical protein